MAALERPNVPSFPKELTKYLSRHNFNNTTYLSEGASGIILTAVNDNLIINKHYVEEIDRELESIVAERIFVVKLVDISEGKLKSKLFKNEVKILKGLFSADVNHQLEISKISLNFEYLPSGIDNICRFYDSKKIRIHSKRYPKHYDDTPSSSLTSSSPSSTSNFDFDHPPSSPKSTRPLKYGMMVMEKMDIDLMDYILETPIISLQKIKFIFKEICKAVNYLHNQKGIVHLDIKPENILLNVIGRSVLQVKLCDFGCAKKCKFQAFSSSLEPETVENNHFGTLNYLAPECFERFVVGSKVSLEKVDIYALGVSLFVLITRQFPKIYHYNGENHIISRLNIVEKIKSNLLCGNVNDWISLVSRMMNDDPNLRPSASEILSLPFIN